MLKKLNKIVHIMLLPNSHPDDMSDEKTPAEAKQDAAESGESEQHEMGESKEFEKGEKEGRDEAELHHKSGMKLKIKLK